MARASRRNVIAAIGAAPVMAQGDFAPHVCHRLRPLLAPDVMMAKIWLFASHHNLRVGGQSEGSARSVRKSKVHGASLKRSAAAPQRRRR